MDEPTASGAAVEEPPAWVPDPTTARVHSPARAADPAPEVDSEPPVDDQAPASSSGAVAPDSTQEVGKRAYVVLEELLVVDVVACALAHLGEAPLTQQQRAELGDGEVYRVVGDSLSGNGTHALRHVAKASFDAGTRPTLAAVPARNFRPKPVTVSADTRVTVG